MVGISQRSRKTLLILSAYSWCLFVKQSWIFIIPKYLIKIWSKHKPHLVHLREDHVCSFCEVLALGYCGDSSMFVALWCGCIFNLLAGKAKKVHVFEQVKIATTDFWDLCFVIAVQVGTLVLFWQLLVFNLFNKHKKQMCLWPILNIREDC